MKIGRRHVIDVALMPIGSYRPVSGRSVHMNPEEALAAFHDLGAKKMVPMHYGSFALTREPLDEPLQRLMLASSAAGLRHRVCIQEPGEPAHLLIRITTRAPGRTSRGSRTASQLANRMHP